MRWSLWKTLFFVGTVSALGYGQPLAAQDCTGACVDDAGFHSNCDMPPFWDSTGSVHCDVLAGGCSVGELGVPHYTCDPLTEEELDGFVHALDDATPMTIGEVMASFEAASFEAVRQSVQITGCNGRIIANIPVRDSLAFALGRLQSTLSLGL